MDTVKALKEVTIKMKFIGTKGKGGDLLAKCELAGVKIHLETRKEYEDKRASQRKDAAESGTDAERYGRVDRLEQVILDPGKTILSGKDVALETFRRDLVGQGFRLVSLEVFQGFGKPANEFLFTTTYATDARKSFELTADQRTLLVWFFSRTYGNLYIWRNYGGEQFDIPALGIRQDARVQPIELRLLRNGREIRLGSNKVEVAFQGDGSTVIA